MKQRIIILIIVLLVPLSLSACVTASSNAQPADVSDDESDFQEAVALRDYIIIRGIQYGTALTELDLSYQQLTDEDIANLKHMTNLEILNLHHNRITDLTKLSELTSLTVLTLSGNQISDWSSVKHVPFVQPDIEESEFLLLFYPDGLDFPDGYNDNIAQVFLQALLNNEYKNIANIVQATLIDAYKFIEDVVFSSGEIVESRKLYDTYSNDEKYERGKIYVIDLVVEKSASPLFPVGKSVWELDVTVAHDYFGAIPRFECVSAPQTDDLNIPLPISDTAENAAVINFCHSFATYIQTFADIDDMNSIVPKWEDDETHYGVFYHNLLDMLAQGDDADDFKRIVKQYLGITNLDFANFTLYNKEDNTVTCFGHGGTWTTINLKRFSFDESTKQYYVTIDYYTDSCRFVIARTVQYILTQNADGTFTMQSIKRIYDSGFPIRVGHV